MGYFQLLDLAVSYVGEYHISADNKATQRFINPVHVLRMPIDNPSAFAVYTTVYNIIFQLQFYTDWSIYYIPSHQHLN